MYKRKGEGYYPRSVPDTTIEAVRFWITDEVEAEPSNWGYGSLNRICLFKRQKRKRSALVLSRKKEMIGAGGAELSFGSKK